MKNKDEGRGGTIETGVSQKDLQGGNTKKQKMKLSKC